MIAELTPVPTHATAPTSSEAQHESSEGWALSTMWKTSCGESAITHISTGDNRTRQQKKQDRERAQPKQIEKFSSREVAQFGVNPRPLVPLSQNTKLLLSPEDPRTDEEIKQDRQRAALEQTYQIFAELAPIDESDQPETTDTETELDSTTLALVPRGVVAVVVFGYFAQFDLVR